MERIRDPKLLLTAQDAFPELERLFMEAEDEISAGFRIFDPETKLVSDAAKAVGDTWADLIADTLRRGVRIRMILSDFDPVIRGALHELTRRSVDGWQSAAEASGAPERLTIIPAMHDGRVGWITRALLWPRVRKELKGEVKELNALPKEEAEDKLSHRPLLRPYLAGEPGDLSVRYWPPAALVPATHHQKLAVFDKKHLFIGGLDINDRRYDTPDHDREAEQTWHDIQIITDGAIAEDAHRHLETMLDTISGGPVAETDPHFLRTLSKGRRLNLFRMSPHPKLAEISDRTKEEVRRAERFIYLESQFLRDPDLARTLEAAAKAKPDLKVLIVLPAAPEDAAFDGETSRDVRYGEYLQAKCLDRVKRAFGNRAFIMAPAQNREGDVDGRAALGGAPIIYIHAKMSIFDAKSVIVSSANLNGRSARWDTEAGLWIDDATVAENMLDRCMRHWLPDDPDPTLLDPDTAVSAWRALAQRNTSRPPTERQGFVMPFPLKTTRRFGKNLPGVPAEMV